MPCIAILKQLRKEREVVLLLLPRKIIALLGLHIPELARKTLHWSFDFITISTLR